MFFLQWVQWKHLLMCIVTVLVFPSQGGMSTEVAATQTSGGCISLVTMALGK